MSDKEKTKDKVEDALKLYRSKLQGLKAKDLEKAILEGLSHAKAEIRALATKVGIQKFDRKWVKSHVMKMVDGEKSKKVLRVIERSYGNDKVRKALAKIQATIKVAPKAEKAEPAPAPEEKADAKAE